MCTFKHKSRDELRISQGKVNRCIQLVCFGKALTFIGFDEAKNWQTPSSHTASHIE